MTDGRKRGEELKKAILKAYETSQETRRSRRIGFSWLGQECDRASWYKYRWADDIEVFEGENARILRLFETGHSQEERLLQDLRRVGASVLNRDPNDNRKQISIGDHDGHLFGFVDGMVSLLPESTSKWVVTECKTHSAKSFAKLQKDGARGAKPEHYAQLQGYMWYTKVPEGLYLAVNKDTDELYCEFIERDDDFCERLIAKAKRIIDAVTPPAKIHRDPGFYKCSFCKAKPVCHLGKLPERNCRTCIESRVGANGTWGCALNDVTLSDDEQVRGCPSHRYLPAFVAGEQTDVDLDTRAVSYQLENGDTWVDQGLA